MLTTLAVAGTLLTFGGCDWAKPEPETHAICKDFLVSATNGFGKPFTWESKERMQAQMRVMAACEEARRITRSEVTISAHDWTITCEAPK